MSAENKTIARKYYEVRNFKFTLNVPEATETSKSDVVGDRTFHREEYNTIIGKITRVGVFEMKSKDETKEWKDLVIFLTDSDGKHEAIKMYLSSREADSFLRRLPNINLKEEATIKIMKQTSEKDKSKKFGLIVVYQDDKKIENAYTKENPNGLPELVKKKIKGKETWDNSDRLEFYEDLIKKVNTALDEKK